MSNDIYKDISTRTGGNIYIGVVGPVRTGKSTFIKEFMEQLVIPNIESDFSRERAIDELPQSSGGRTIMTTEPKFIPEEAVNVKLASGAAFNVKMIDCVGYIIPSAQGYIENEAPRMVMTPWFDEEIPFNMAAEVGTRKVITEHSTIGLVVTTDGSITGLPREEYEECEERIIEELRQINKPFAVILNCADPDTYEAKELARELSEKYGTAVIAVNCLALDEEAITDILTNILYAFPIKEIDLSMPTWINSLPAGHWLKSEIFSQIRAAAKDVNTLRDIDTFAESISQSEWIEGSSVMSIDAANGSALIKAELRNELFFKVIGEAAELDINDENDLMPQIMELMKIKKRFMKYQNAIDEMEATGYGIVLPEAEELKLDAPEIMRQSGKYGIRLRAKAPAIHLMKTTINTEVAPIVGSQKQSEELALYMLGDFEDDPEKIWESNIFGKSVHELVKEGLNGKLAKLPDEARLKIRETIERMINEGCSGLICFIL
ncbi:MAG: stage IV sporulation protein A [Ruminococcus sp.]|nr:stage IV sporulation protein A [Ruminococcus sp.]